MANSVEEERGGGSQRLRAGMCYCGFMPDTLESSPFSPRVNERRRRTTIVAAGVCLAFPCFFFAWSWNKLELDPFLLLGWPFAILATVIYVVVILRVRSEDQKRIRRGLAWAVCGPAVLILGGWWAAEPSVTPAFILVAGFFTLVQLVLLASAVATYHSMERKPGDARMLGQRAALLGIAFLIALVLASIISDTLKSGIVANEAVAVAALRAINTAEAIYASTYKSGFTDTLARLCPPQPGKVPDANAAGLLRGQFLEEKLCGGAPARFRRSGYDFSYVPRGKFGEIISYELRADPVTRNATGQRSFRTDESSVIRSNDSGPATPSDPPIEPIPRAGSDRRGGGNENPREMSE